VRAGRKELNEFCDTGKGPVEFSVFTKADGLPSNECSGFQPAVWKGADGRLWFATLNGLAILDPKHLPENKLSPPVVIEAVLADDKPLALPGAVANSGPVSLRIPAGVLRLELRFAALSYTAPEKNRFRCRLDGVDSGWVHVGTVPDASYAHLSPGTYLFHVTACNNDGAWNETGAALGIEMLPFFWQTKCFEGLITAVGIGLVGWVFRARLAQVERRRQSTNGIRYAKKWPVLALPAARNIACPSSTTCHTHHVT